MHEYPSYRVIRKEKQFEWQEGLMLLLTLVRIWQMSWYACKYKNNSLKFGYKMYMWYQTFD